jgi:glucokinase
MEQKTRQTAENKPDVLAVDIGGTKMLAAVFRDDGKMGDSIVRPTLVEQGVKAAVERLEGQIEDLMAKNGLKASRLAGIGIACAGGIDTGRGMVATPSPNLPDWVEVPLRDIIQEKFKVETHVINDASAAALGEHRHGAGRGVNDLVLFTVGTGIGGGIIADGQVYLGAVGAAGEFGHMTVDAHGPKCGCGNTGCLEMLASGRAVEREAIKRIKEGQSSLLRSISGNKIESISAKQVEEAARKGDELALKIIESAAYYLGIGMVNIVNIFNPEMIIIGGGMAEMEEMLIGPGRRMVEERAFRVSARAVRIVTAELGNEAGVYGAAVYAREAVKRRKG